MLIFIYVTFNILIVMCVCFFVLYHTVYVKHFKLMVFQMCLNLD